MRCSRAEVWCVLLVLVLAVGWPAYPAAQTVSPPASDSLTRAQRLDELFDRLKATADEAEGEAIVAEIWQVWMQSGNAEIDAAMQRVVLVMGRVPALAR